MVTPPIEVVQELYRAFREKDYEKFLQICSPDLEWIQNQGFPRGSTWHGPQAVIEGVFRTFDDSWEDWRFEIEQYLNAGSTVIVVGAYQGQHRMTRKHFISPAAHLYEVEAGKIRRFRQFADTKVIWDAMAP